MNTPHRANQAIRNTIPKTALDTPVSSPDNSSQLPRPIAAAFGSLPETGFVRLPTVLEVIPISAAAWWQGILDGRYPRGIKLSSRTTAWRVEHIRALISALE